jgi:hypothetical protein
MPTVTIRLGEPERDALRLEAQTRGVSVSEIVREALGQRTDDVDARLRDLDRRLATVERMAGIE